MRTAIVDLRMGSVRLDRTGARPLPSAAWSRVRVELAGICGSDLHLLHPDGTASPIFKGLFPAQVELGHELVGVIVEAGSADGLPAGTRVVVDPLLGCIVNGRHACRSCREGWPASCEHVDQGPVRGYAIGFTSGLGAGWGDEVLAHESQLHVVPDGLAPTRAVLAEPLAVCLHALARTRARTAEQILVIGAGTVGLLALVAIRREAPHARVCVVARHNHQECLARALGANSVVRPASTDGPMADLAMTAGTTTRGQGEGATLRGGFDVVVEAAGTETALSLATRACRPRGEVVLLGVQHRIAVDLAPVWARELSVLGAFHYGHGAGSDDIDDALALLVVEGCLARLVTHVHPLDDLSGGLALASDRASGAVKVAFRP